MNSIQLRNGVSFPPIGAGLWKITDRQMMFQVMESAWQCGYRLFDTAAAYSNEVALGKALQELHLPRDQTIVQDKLWITCYGYEDAQTACKRSLKKLKLEYLDVYLMHWPASVRQSDNWEEVNAETWRGMETLYQEGYVRSIGVCNFKLHHLEALTKTAVVPPFLHQLECHPGMLDKKMEEYCREKGIQIQASSPLGNGQLLNNSLLSEAASESNATIAQLCLKWGMDHGYIVLPKTGNPLRMRENFSSQHIELSINTMQLLDNIPFCGGLAIDSDEVNNFDGI